MAGHKNVYARPPFERHALVYTLRSKRITDEMGREFSLHYSVKRLGQYRRIFQAIAIESQFSEVVLSINVMQYG